MTQPETRRVARPTTVSGTGRRCGAVLWIVAVGQYFAVQALAAARWSTGYSWTGNVISDLGNTTCGPFSLPHGQPQYVCSPDHAIMNASFIAAGLLTIAGITLLRSTWPARRSVRAAAMLWLIAGAGKVLVGLVPENANITVHTVAALNIPLGSLAILLLSLAVRHTARRLATAGFVLAFAGLVGTVLSVTGSYAGHGAYLGTGAGGSERLAAYPGNLWMVLIGVVVLASPNMFARKAADRS